MQSAVEVVRQARVENAQELDPSPQTTSPAEASHHTPPTERPRPSELPNLPSSRQTGKKLAIAFALLLATLLGMGYLTLHHLGRVYASLQETLNARLEKLQLAQEGLRCSSENSRITMQLFLVKDKEAAGPLLARRAENSNKISSAIARIEHLCVSDQEKKLLQAVEENRASYVGSYQRALQLLLANNAREAAQELMVQETTPALFRYHLAWDAFLGFQLEQCRAESEHSKYQYATIRLIAIALILLAGLVGVTIAVTATRTVTSVISFRIRMQNEIRTLNKELEQRVSRRTRDLVVTEEQLRGSLTELQEYTTRVEALNELVELLQSCLTLAEAYQQASLALKHFYPAGALLMLNPSRNLLDVTASWGTPFSKQGPFSPDNCWALRKGRLHEVHPDNFSLLCNHIEQGTAGGFLCIPMVAHGEALGVLSVRISTGCDTVVDAHSLQCGRELAVSLTDQMSLAFANLMLRETLKHQSVRDPLTGLFNRRHMEEALERELSRATRNGQPVAVLMADIDHFKEFNDAFGHEAGDVALRDLGSLLRSEVRGGDIACRYGGEEFLLILTDSDLHTACERARKLMEQVRNMHVRHGGETLRRITLSVGVACFPQHGTVAPQIIRAADEALYKAKADGRDRVIHAEVFAHGCEQTAEKLDFELF